MKILNITLALLIGFVTNLMAQGEEGPIDPLLGGYTIGTSDEIILLWADFNSTGEGYFHHKIFDYASFNNPDINNEIIIKSKDSIPGQLPAQEFLDAFSEDLNGDGLDEMVATWSGDDNQFIRIVINQIDSTDYSFIKISQLDVLNENETIGLNTQIRLVPGNFDKDVGKEFILAYLTEDSVKVILFDSDGTLIPERKADIQDESIYLNNSAINYDITTGDFDGDGTDELVMVGGERIQTYDADNDLMVNKETMYVKVYDLIKTAEDYVIQAKAKASKIEIVNGMMDGDPINYELNGLRITTVDFDNNGTDEIVVGYQVYDNQTYFLLQSMQAYQNLDSIRINDNRIYIHQEVLNEKGGSMSITSEDLTSDGKEEVIFAAWNKLAVYNADVELNLVPIAEIIGLNISGAFSGDRNHRTLAVTDLDASVSQDEWRKEIILFDKQEVGEFSETKIEIRVYEAKIDYTSKLNLLRKAVLQDESIHTPSVSPVALVTGNFEGDGMRLGTPKRYKETDIIQPLVILNAPPVHFDILNDLSYDISDCFNGGDCNFIATYEEGLSLTEQITTTLNSDWGVELKLSSTNEVGGNKLNNHLTTNYGENFSNVENASKTVTVGVQVKAINDDLIYATVADYTVWEYPVYNDNQFQGYITTVVPELTENRWFPSKSWSGNPYIPNHEVGNLLSYPEYSEVQKQDESIEKIKGVENNNYAIGPNTSYEWRLEFNDFLENNASRTRKIGLEVGTEIEKGTAGTIEISGEPGGVGVGVSQDYRISIGLGLIGKYNRESFSSHTTTVKKDLLLKVNLGNINETETGYQITPYAFWSKSGALVIDYAVDVDQSEQGYTPTWWQQQYGTLPDPALILPWKLDPEKGYGLIRDVKRQQTKDIVIYPKDPQPGDTILLYARIHNYSLIPTSSPVKISFYLGDPDLDGELIESIDGETILTTENVLSPRSFQWVHMECIMPPAEGRLYVVIDPENSMDEIHENNNKGWIALGPTVEDPNGIITGIADLETDIIPDLLQTFPNPFSSFTNIKFNLEKADKISLKVYDLFGQEISTLINEEILSGEHHVEFDGSRLPTGIYICRLEGINYVAAERLFVR